MTIRGRISVLVAVGCSVLLIAGIALAAKAATTVTIKGPDHVYGYIHSQKAKCLGGRTVRVYKQKGSTQKPSVDKVMDSTTSDRQGSRGNWDIGNPGFPSGKYYAEVTKTSSCQSAFSKTVKF